MKIERENNLKQYKSANDIDLLPKFGAGSEYGRDLKEESRRKKYVWVFRWREKLLYDINNGEKKHKYDQTECRFLSLLAMSPIRGGKFSLGLNFLGNKIWVLLRFEFPILADCVLVITRTVHLCC